MARTWFRMRSRNGGQEQGIHIDWDVSGTRVTIRGIGFGSSGAWQWNSDLQLVIHIGGVEVYNQSVGSYGATHTSAGGIFNSRGLPAYRDMVGYGEITVFAGSRLNASSYAPQVFGQLGHSGGDGYGFTTASGPTLAGASTSSSSDGPYHLRTSISDVNYGQGSSWGKLICRVNYNLDGQPKETSAEWPGYPGSATFNVTDINRLPDDETVQITWTIQTNIGADARQRSQYIPPSYEAYVITEDSIKQADLFVSASPGSSTMKKVRRVNKL